MKLVAQILYWGPAEAAHYPAAGHEEEGCYQALTFPDSISGRLCGEPLSTKRTLKK